MMPIRALLIAYAFPPWAAAEAWVAAKIMGSLGDVEVDVITTSPPGGTDHSLDDWVASRFSTVTSVRGPRLARLPTSRMGPLLNIPDVFRLVGRRVIEEARDSRRGRYDVVVSRSQPHSGHLAAAAIARRLDLPWVACFSDPWTMNPFVYQGRLAMALNSRLEARVIDQASKIVVTSEQALPLIIRDPDVAARKGAVIPHAFVPELYPRNPERRREVVFRHLGTFYGPRTPDPLFVGIQRLISRRSAQRRDLRVELVGPLQHRFLQSPAALELPPGMITTLGSVEHVRSLALMGEADVLVTVDAPLEASPFLPSKLIDYVGAGRPVVGITAPGPARDLVRSLGGWVADPRDAGAIAEALAGALTWIEADRGRSFGIPEVRQRYQARRVGSQFRELLLDAING